MAGWRILAEIREQLHTVANADFQDERIDWLSQERDSSMVFNSAPLDVGPTLRSGLFDQKECVVLSSATLTAQGTFDFIRHRLGLEGAEELSVGSPFDYKKSTLLAIPDDIPPPNARGYRDALERCIGQIVRNAGGHTMALFTSHAALRAARQTLIRTVEDSGITVLAQGVDGPPHRLMRRFAENPRSVLLGTSSFWEGVDLPSGVMKALILARLPFNVPTEPVFAARGEQYEDSVPAVCRAPSCAPVPPGIWPAHPQRPRSGGSGGARQAGSQRLLRSPLHRCAAGMHNEYRPYVIHR